jgi:hypothetical protein
MKLNPNLTQQQISKHEVVHPSETTRADEYIHPWYQFLNKPNPPSTEAVDRAKFVDKTYHWSGSNSIRSGDKRSTK